MLISEIGMSNDRGFTLFELLIVIVIIGIMTGLALLSFGDFGASRKINAAAENLTQYIKLVEEQAIIESRPFELSINSEGYEIKNFTKSKSKLAHFLRWRPFPKDTTLSLESTTKGKIIIYSTGELSPFKLRFGSKTIPNLLYLKGMHNGDLSIELPNEN